MMERFSTILRKISGQRLLLSVSSADARVYLMLNNMLQKTGGNVIENLPTQQEMASMINTSRETVSRAIQKLIKQGILRKEKRKLIVINAEKLQKLLSKDA
jgi:DNA-binding GntR family transcriptional regulator